MGSGGTTALRPPGKFFVLCTQFFIASAALPALVKSVTYFCMLLPFLRLPPCCCANYCVLNSESVLKIVSHPPKHLRRCKVKPHGSLVPVSSTHRCARIRIFECPHRLSDKLLKSSAASLFLSGAGCAYYAFPLQSQAFIFAFLREVLV